MVLGVVQIVSEIMSVLRKRVETLKIMETSEALYRTLRSFVESSNKDSYLWNKGIKLDSKIMFVKPGKWVLEVMLYDKVELGAKVEVVSLKSYIDNRVELSLYFKVDSSYLAHVSVFDIMDNVSVLGGFDVYMPYNGFENVYKLAFYNANVPYAYPIVAVYVLDKINKFIDLDKYYTMLLERANKE